MTISESTNILQEELTLIAPDMEVDMINQDGDLLEEFDIDSMDFLNLVAALGKRLNAAMPESDYPRMRTFNNMVKYIDEVKA